jgi:hypothetical protein
VRRSNLTCIGALTDASNRICFVQCVGPTYAGKWSIFVLEVLTTDA